MESEHRPCFSNWWVDNFSAAYVRLEGRFGRHKMAIVDQDDETLTFNRPIILTIIISLVESVVLRLVCRQSGNLATPS